MIFARNLEIPVQNIIVLNVYNYDFETPILLQAASSKNTTNYLTVTGTSVELSAGFGMDPVETSYWISVTVPYIADGYVV